MGASAYLKTVREEGYNPAKPKSDPDQENNTSRIIKLSDDEQKALQGGKPGEEVVCEVRGNLEEDGHFHVMSVSPTGGAQPSGEGQMADQVAQKVNPFMGMMGK